MKTVMQIVYEFIEVGEKQYGHQRDALLSELLKRKTELLDKEKEQIMDAYSRGAKDPKTLPEGYYNYNYK